MKIKRSTFLLATMFAATCANGATTLVSSTFESGLDSWQVSTQAGHYVHNVTNQPADTNNYAAGGTGAVRINGASRTLTIPAPLALATGGYTSVTVSFDDQFFNGSSSRRAQLQYSSDGGTSWFILGGWDTSESPNGLNNSTRTASATLTPGPSNFLSRTGSWHGNANGQTPTGDFQKLKNHCAA